MKARDGDVSECSDVEQCTVEDGVFAGLWRKVLSNIQSTDGFESPDVHNLAMLICYCVSDSVVLPLRILQCSKGTHRQNICFLAYCRFFMHPTY